MKRTYFFLLFCYSLVAADLGAQTLRSTNGFETIAGYSSAVAVSDGSVFIGEPANSITPGLVYIYQSDPDGAWQEVRRLSSDAATVNDGFGAAIAVDGNTLVVSAVREDDGTGAVYVYSKANGVWMQQARLSADDAEAHDGFGLSLAVGGGTILVGAPGQNGGTGAVYRFEDNGSGVWDQAAKLTAPAGVGEDLFGTSLALTDASIFVGAPGRSSREGVVYVYDRTTGDRSATELSAFGLERNGRFGSSVAVQGDQLLIGAARHQRSMGAVFVYRLEEGEWNQTGSLLPFDASPNVRFGSAVDMTDGAVWVGAPGADGFVGAIYFLEANEYGGWQSAQKLSPQDGTRRSQFGITLAVEGDVAVVGRPGMDSGTGSASIYERINGDWHAVASVVGAIEALDSISGTQVDCQDGKANAFDCESVDLVSFMSIKDLGGGRGIDLNDIWGWTDPETGKEWVLVGRTNGTSFIDISDPARPFYAGELMLTDGAQPNAWRDIKVYRDYAFIVADGAGPHGMQVFDLTRLRDVINAPELFTADALYKGIASAHNIVINEDTGYAYAVGASGGGETCGGGLHMINIQHPTDPQFAGCFSDSATGRSGTGYSHDAMCVVYHGPDTEHVGQEICFGSNETALSIADVTDKSNPTALSNASYPNVSYAHQGWITDDHQYFYLDDELDELQGRVPSTRTLIWDITDLDDPQLLKEYQSASKASDHNLYIQGNYMYQSNYVAGLRVLDISDPANPVEIGYFDTVPVGENGPGFAGSWSNYPFFKSGNIVVTSISEGLFIVKKRELDI